MSKQDGQRVLEAVVFLFLYQMTSRKDIPVTLLIETQFELKTKVQKSAKINQRLKKQLMENITYVSSWSFSAARVAVLSDVDIFVSITKYITVLKKVDLTDYATLGMYYLAKTYSLADSKMLLEALSLYFLADSKCKDYFETITRKIWEIGMDDDNNENFVLVSFSLN